MVRAKAWGDRSGEKRKMEKEIEKEKYIERLREAETGTETESVVSSCLEGMLCPALQGPSLTHCKRSIGREGSKC